MRVRSPADPRKRRLDPQVSRFEERVRVGVVGRWHGMKKHFEAVATSTAFQRIIITTILFAGALVGIETYSQVVADYGFVVHTLDKIVLGIFVVEIVIKMGAEGSRPWRYFHDGWNVFDFTIVAVCFLPLDAQYVTVLRLARLLRVLKLLHTLPRLQLLVGALMRSLPSMGYVALLLFLLFYVYAVAATFLFGANDPLHFGTLQRSFLSLFQIVTLEGWTDLLDIQMQGCANTGYDTQMALCVASTPQPIVATVFFVSFILLGTMVMLNLFIGVITTSMSEAQTERDAEERTRQRGDGPPLLADELHLLTAQLEQVQLQLARVRERVVRDRP